MVINRDVQGLPRPYSILGPKIFFIFTKLITYIFELNVKFYIKFMSHMCITAKMNFLDFRL